MNGQAPVPHPCTTHRYEIYRHMTIRRGQRRRRWWRKTKPGAISAAWLAYARSISVFCEIRVFDQNRASREREVLRISERGETSGPWADDARPE